MILKHKYITNPSITTGDDILNTAKQFNSSLCGSIPPPLFNSGIDNLRALTGIFDATKEGYDEREKIKSKTTSTHSPRVPMGSPSPRVTRVKNLLDLVPVEDSDSDDKGDKKESNQLVIVCPRPIVVPLKAQATPLPPILDYRNYDTLDEDISPPARNTRPQSNIFSIMDKVMLSCFQMSCTSYQIDRENQRSEISVGNVLRNGRISIGWGDRRFVRLLPPHQAPPP